MNTIAKAPESLARAAAREIAEWLTGEGGWCHDGEKHNHTVTADELVVEIMHSLGPAFERALRAAADDGVVPWTGPAKKCGACDGGGWLWNVNLRVPCDLCQPVLRETYLEMSRRCDEAGAALKEARAACEGLSAESKAYHSRWREAEAKIKDFDEQVAGFALQLDRMHLNHPEEACYGPKGPYPKLQAALKVAEERIRALENAERMAGEPWYITTVEKSLQAAQLKLGQAEARVKDLEAEGQRIAVQRNRAMDDGDHMKEVLAQVREERRLAELKIRLDSVRIGVLQKALRNVVLRFHVDVHSADGTTFDECKRLWCLESREALGDAGKTPENKDDR